MSRVFHIPMPVAQIVSPPVLGVIPREYVDEPYIIGSMGFIIVADCVGLCLSSLSSMWRWSLQKFT